MKKADAYIQKKFSSQELKEANKLMSEYLDIMDRETSYEDLEKFLKKKKFLDNSHTIASKFCFNFESEKKNNPLGIKTPMEFEKPLNTSNSFTVAIFPKDDIDAPEAIAEHLLPSILPDWTAFTTELHIEAHEGPEGMTVEDFFEQLLEMGFEYSGQKPEPCLFRKELSKAKIIVAPIEDNAVKTNQSKSNTPPQALNPTQLIVQAEKIIKADKKEELLPYLEMLADGQYKDGIKEKLLNIAAEKKAFSCFDLLIENGANIWGKDSAKSDHLVVSNLVYNFNKTPYFKKVVDLLYGKPIPESTDFIEMAKFLDVFEGFDKQEAKKLIKHVEENTTEENFKKMILQKPLFFIEMGYENKFNEILKDGPKKEIEKMMNAVHDGWDDQDLLKLLKKMEKKVDLSDLKLGNESLLKYAKDNYVSNYESYQRELNQRANGLTVMVRGDNGKFELDKQKEREFKQSEKFYNFLKPHEKPLSKLKI